MSKLRPIDAGSVHRICSGQVVYDLGACVKELVENALDAGATSIEVRLKEYGSDLIEVADNGSGIAAQDYHSATLKHHTSKLVEFRDLEGLETLGFRGEALSSLCALADVSIVTRTADDTVGTRLEYDHDGVITSQSAAARAVGTTVAVKDIFKPLPVRHQELQRNIRRIFGKLVQILQGYALISKGVRFFCSNQSGSGGRTTVLSTSGQQEIREHVVSLFGSKVAAALQSLDEEIASDVRVCGLLSSAGSAVAGRSNGDRQFFFVNGRPVDMPKVVRLMNEAFKATSSSTASMAKPMAVLNWLLPTTRVDINLTPDKRKIFLHDEAILMKSFQQVLQKVWDPSLTVFCMPKTLLPCKRPLSSSTAINDDVGRTSNIGTQHIQGSQIWQSSNEAQNCDMMDGSDTVMQGMQQGPKTPPLTRAPNSGPSKQLPSFSLLAHRPSAGHDTDPVQSMTLTHGRNDSKAFTSTARRRSTVGMTGLECFAIGGIRASAAAKSAGTPGSAQTLLPFKCIEDKDAKELHSQAEEPPEPHTPVDRPSQPHSSAAAASNPFLPQVIDLSSEQHSQESVNEERRDQVASQNGAAANSQTPRSHGPKAGPVWDDQPIQSAMPWDDSTTGPLGPEIGIGKPCTPTVQPGDTLNASQRAPSAVSIDWTLQTILDDLQSDNVSPSALDPAPTFSFQAATLQEQHVSLDDGCEGEVLADAELDRAFQQADFRSMQVIGQFNLGFIIARLGVDLWIIDQHAADEKYNFERLQATTVLNRQPLLCPLDMGLSLTEDLALREHIDTFAKNGFAFVEGPEGRLRMTAVPFSQRITFGKDDARELLSILEGGTGAAMAVGSASQTVNHVASSVIRPSKVRAMLASRACRSSIMVGRALDRVQMRRVLDHLADLKSPWKCPHGRPTLKHLSRLSAPSAR